MRFSRAVRRINRQWLRATAFTLLLVGLVAAGIGHDWESAAGAVFASAIGFGFFYMMFPGGEHFGFTVANLLAVYACVFVYFREASFPDAPYGCVLASLALPVLGFLAGCFLRRRHVSALIIVRRRHDLTNLPRLSRWVPGLLAIGVASFLVPRFHLGLGGQGAAFVLSGLAIAALVGWAARDVVLLMLDVAQVFENVAGRLRRLLMPVMAFLTYYSLLVVVFACLYRIVQATFAGPMFLVHAEPRLLGFGDALYFSVITLATVGYGDITPAGALVRVLATFEVVAGLLLLLFGFSEIMRTVAPDSERRRPREPDDVS